MGRLCPPWAAPLLLRQLVAIVCTRNTKMGPWCGRTENAYSLPVASGWQLACKPFGGHMGVLPQCFPLQVRSPESRLRKRTRLSSIWCIGQGLCLDEQMTDGVVGRDGWPSPLKHSSPIVPPSAAECTAAHGLCASVNIHQPLSKQEMGQLSFSSFGAESEREN